MRAWPLTLLRECVAVEPSEDFLPPSEELGRGLMVGGCGTLPYDANGFG
jgi:hypothetical protein